MNLSDVRTRVKRQFGDESQVQINDADIARWANDAQRAIVMQSDSLLQKASTDNVVANQQEYALPADLLVLRAVSLRRTATVPYFPLLGLSLQQFDSTIGSWDGADMNKGYAGYYHVYAGVLKLYPIPFENSANALKYYYSRIPNVLNVDGDVIDLPLMYHNAVVNYCLQQAYELDDASWDAAKIKAGQVQSDISVNKGRENRSPTGAYGSMTTLPEDL